jgi:hypothetical protein
MTKRRMGTCPHRTFWTAETVQQIEAYQRQQHIPSFSAAAETLVRLGLAHDPAAVLAPVVTSAIHHALHREFARLIKLQVYTAIEAGIAQRFAAAAVRDVGRLKQDDPERFTRIRAAAIADTRRRLHRDNISAIIADLYAELTSEDQAPQAADDRTRSGS